MNLLTGCGRRVGGAVDMTTGLAAFWPLNNVYTDSSGNGNTLSAVGSPDFTTSGPLNRKILRSPTTSDYAERDGFVVGSGDISIGGWFYYPGAANTFMVQCDDGVISNFIALRWVTGTHLYFNCGGLTAAVGPTTLSTGWHHIFGTYDGSAARLYHNSILLATASGTATYPTTVAPKTRILGSYDGVAVANVLASLASIWSIALNARQISTLYNGGVGFDPTPAVLELSVSDSLGFSDSISI